ncbi:hypothetical protein [Tractidigestivibacter sp.]|uniref:hypothetical protein n=1 Tax=Tractidigestivibacter sp. TaxID=2847320 RepID=UPI002A7FC3CA|nr:hypothetical protein [Tractidigestivibacter sp.]MDY4535088.1 hypothetical protein [Tractidigestivibacter sp.]MDY5271498.1 hypothetical protein [Tractidigestivibacter sp.]
MDPEITDSDLERSVSRLSRLCRLSSRLLFILSIIVMLPLLLSPLILVGAFLAIGPFSYEGSISDLLLMIVQSALASTALCIITRVFVDIAKKKPFYIGQASHLMIAGILMLVCTFVEVIPYDSATLSLTLGPLYIGLELSKSPGCFINLGSLLCSISLLTISAVFRYGYLLQRISDDTV